MKATTNLFETEGRENLKATITHVSKAATSFDVRTVIVFAAFVDSVLRLRDVLDETREIVAVTFPAGFTALIEDVPSFVGITEETDHARLHAAGITLVRGVMPFFSLGSSASTEVSTFRSALDLFGGGLQLCVQAILMGCDAGAVPTGERCIAMSADTAIVAQPENTFRILGSKSRFSVEHIICKPITYSISRPSVSQPSTTKIVSRRQGENLRLSAAAENDGHEE